MKSRFILVADTSDAFLDILKSELATTDFALLHAKNGQEAIDYLELLKSEIDLAIIELELPVVSGLDVIGKLAKRKQAKPTRIIVVSAVDVPVPKQIVKKLGIAAVVQSPKQRHGWRKIIEGVMGKELGGYSQDSSPGTSATS